MKLIRYGDKFINLERFTFIVFSEEDHTVCFNFDSTYTAIVLPAKEYGDIRAKLLPISTNI